MARVAELLSIKLPAQTEPESIRVEYIHNFDIAFLPEITFFVFNKA